MYNILVYLFYCNHACMGHEYRQILQILYTLLLLYIFVNNDYNNNNSNFNVIIMML